MIARRKRIACLCLVLCMLCSAWQALAQTVTVVADGYLGEGEVTWDFPYDDAYFTASSDTYSHDLARASLGLAYASFRRGFLPLPEKGSSAQSFLTQAGFADIRLDEFDIPSTAHTIASAIGSKTVGEGEDAFTLIAVGISGGKYGKEWLSNFTIGNALSHSGFTRAASIVELRLKDYIALHAQGKPIKIWIAGFSRAAAVGNVLAASLVKNKVTAPESIYAYCFATPNNTREATPGAIVYNILGQFDPIPTTPFTEWGYTREGTTLRLPALETNSDYAARVAPVKEVFAQVANGTPYWVNPEANYLWRKGTEFLYSIIPDVAEYTDTFQNLILSVMATEGSSIDKMSAAMRYLSTSSDARGRLFHEVGSFCALVSEILYDYTMQALSLRASNWYSGANLSVNLTREHTPESYISWLFAYDDPALLYTDLTAYKQMIVSGPAFVTVRDESGTMVAHAMGGISIGGDQISLASFRIGDATVIALPSDADYKVTIRPHEDGEFSYYIRECDARYFEGRSMLYERVPVKADQVWTSTLRGTPIDAQCTGILNDGERDMQPTFDSATQETPDIDPMIELSLPGISVTQLYLPIAGGVALLLALFILIGTPRHFVKRHRRKKAARAAAVKAAEPEAPQSAG